MKIYSHSKRAFILSYVIFFSIINLFFACSGSGGAGSESGSEDDPASGSMSSTLFGVNLSWERLGDSIMQNGDLLRDSSFRYFDDGDIDTEDVWIKVDTSSFPKTGVITRIIDEADPGYTPPVGSVVKAHTGYARIYQTGAAALTGVLQQLKVNAAAGETCTLSFSSYGTGGDSSVYVYLYDNSTPQILATASGNCNVLNGVWTRHDITLTPTADTFYVGIYLFGAGDIKIDEVRLFKTGLEPSVKGTVKTKIADLGVKSLRWPGGTLADWFEWKDSIGSLVSRGELATYNGYEIPALGLHEFLNLCEELGIRPLIIVNVRAGAQNAADLVEYILGPSTSAQGAIRMANGRTAPWDAPYFEIGNEPPDESAYDYGYDSSALEDMGSDYADRAGNIITAMNGKASDLKKAIYLGGISETAFQLSDWLSVTSLVEIIRMIAKWNSQVLGGTFLSKTNFVSGHFYSSRFYHTNTPGVPGGAFIPGDHYKYLMAGGTVLKRTINEKIKPLTGSLPLWLTEYHVLIKEDGVDMPKFDYCMDYQSGLSIADMLMKMIESGVNNAYTWNLSQDGSFGLLGSKDGWYYRPAGLVFKMFSVIEGEEKLAVSHNNADTFTITTGRGNVPSGLGYDLISVLATKNKLTGKPRLFVLNRDYSADKTITVTLDGYTPGNGKVYLYNNADLLKNNEANPHNAITVVESTQSFSDPLVITIPAHSFKRIDF